MNAKEIKALVRALREAGVTHYKTADMELSFKAMEDIPAESKPKRKKLEAEADEPGEIKHTVEEMTSLLKLSDTELVDRLFPDHTDYGDDEEPVSKAS